MLSGLRSRNLLRRWWLTEKKLVPIVASIFRLEDFREAFKAMTKRSASKMIVRIERSSGAARMAPLLHHFQQNGWTELQIMIRFWIISWCWRSPAAPHSNSVDDDSPTRHAIAWLWASLMRPGLCKMKTVESIAVPIRGGFGRVAALIRSPNVRTFRATRGLDDPLRSIFHLERPFFSALAPPERLGHITGALRGGEVL